MDNIKKIAAGIALTVIGVPTLVFSGTFASELAGGKTPSEAIYSIAEEVGYLFGRVSELEADQAKFASTTAEAQREIARQVESLKTQNEELKANTDSYKTQTESLKKENENIKAGIQEAYDYTDSVNESLSEVIEKNILPTEVRRLELKSTQYTRFGNKIHFIIQVHNSGNKEVAISKIDFSISGIDMKNIGRVDVGGETKFDGEINTLFYSIPVKILVSEDKSRGIDILVALVGLDPGDVEKEAAKVVISLDRIYSDGEVSIQFPIK